MEKESFLLTSAAFGPVRGFHQYFCLTVICNVDKQRDVGVLKTHKFFFLVSIWPVPHFNTVDGKLENVPNFNEPNPNFLNQDSVNLGYVNKGQAKLFGV